MSDRIVVMNEGRIEQIGTPFEIYNYPRTRFVASFVGTLNILRGKVIDPAAGRIAIDGQEIVVGARRARTRRRATMRSVALRPEAIVLGAAPATATSMQGTIEEVSFLGSVVRIRVRFGENARVARHLQQSERTTARARRTGDGELCPGGSAGARRGRAELALGSIAGSSRAMQ